MESYLQEMKQLLQQYFLLLNGSRKMTGKFQGLDAEFDVGHSCEIELRAVEPWTNVWYPELRGSGPLGEILFYKGSIITYDPDYDSPCIFFYDKTFSDYGYVNYQTPDLIISCLTGDISFAVPAGKNVSIGPAGDFYQLEGYMLGVGYTAISGSLPTPSASYRYKLCVKQGKQFPPPGTEDELYICLKESDNSFAWKKILGGDS